MPHPNSTPDTLPWHRQFWPWFLIALPASVVVAALITLVIANRNADDLVVDEYYRDGLAINRQLERKQLATQLNISAQLFLNKNFISVKTTGPIKAEILKLHLSHPLEAAQDFHVELIRTGPALYQSELPRPAAPRWHWILASGEEEAWRLDGSLTLANFERAGID